MSNNVKTKNKTHGNLILPLKKNQILKIGNVFIKVERIQPDGTMTFCINAPKEIKIDRIADE